MSGSGTVSVSLRTLSFASLFVALASLVTLSIVVTVKDVDALSTIALALAILAFVVQLIVFIVQAAEASRQVQQATELHARMMSVLAQIEERTHGTQQSLDCMNTTLLEAVIGKAASESSTVLTEQFAQTLASMLNEGDVDRGQTSARGAVGFSESFPTLPPDLAAQIHAEMCSWPAADELEDLVAELERLDSDELLRLGMYAGDLMRTTVPGSTLGPGVRSALPITEYYERRPGTELQTLSASGRRIGRIITAGGTPPAFQDRIEALRVAASDGEGE